VSVDGMSFELTHRQIQTETWADTHERTHMTSFSHVRTLMTSFTHVRTT